MPHLLARARQSRAPRQVGLVRRSPQLAVDSAQFELQKAHAEHRFGGLPLLLRRVDEVLASAAGRPGHVFNLGHGVLPPTPVDDERAVVERVRERTASPVPA